MWRERWSPPSGLGATCPTRRFCCDQRLALARLTPKRSAACRQVAPDETADATRWRRSTDKVVGMVSPPCPANPQPPSAASDRTNPALAASMGTQLRVCRDRAIVNEAQY